MSQQELNGAQVGPGFEQVGCKTVSKRMGRDRFDNAATLMRLLARMLYRRLADMPADLISPGTAIAWAWLLATSYAGFAATLEKA
jgi:hypothetical protein